MFVILPFEKEFYKRFNFSVDFVGHPLLDAVSEYSKNENKLTTRSEKPIIALLPGSRKQEISAVLPIMLSVVKYYKDYQFVIAAAPIHDMDVYKSFIGNLNVEVVVNQTYQLLQKAEFALVTSGTATLEAALFGVPEVVCYKGGAISFAIAKQLVKVEYISLVNLIMEEEIVKELIQDELNENNLKNEINKLMNSENRLIINRKYSDLKEKLGGAGASKKTATLMFNYLNASSK